jgi:hypothetical protein
VTKRKQRKAIAQWETETRTWATCTARALILAICGGEPIPVNPYRVGVVLDLDEQAWVECPLRFTKKHHRRQRGPREPTGHRSGRGWSRPGESSLGSAMAGSKATAGSTPSAAASTSHPTERPSPLTSEAAHRSSGPDLGLRHWRSPPSTDCMAGRHCSTIQGSCRFGRIPLRNLVERRLRSPAEAANSRSGE